MAAPEQKRTNTPSGFNSCLIVNLIQAAGQRDGAGIATPLRKDIVRFDFAIKAVYVGMQFKR